MYKILEENNEGSCGAHFEKYEGENQIDEHMTNDAMGITSLFPPPIIMNDQANYRGWANYFRLFYKMHFMACVHIDTWF